MTLQSFPPFPYLLVMLAGVERERSRPKQGTFGGHLGSDLTGSKLCNSVALNVCERVSGLLHVLARITTNHVHGRMPPWVRDVVDAYM